jgi:hypothetical protein
LIAHRNIPTITPTASATRATFKITIPVLIWVSFPGTERIEPASKTTVV